MLWFGANCPFKTGFEDMLKPALMMPVLPKKIDSPTSWNYWEFFFSSMLKSKTKLIL